MSTLIPILADKYMRSYPKHRDAQEIGYVPIEEVFGTVYDSDAHFACYSVPDVPHRLGREYLAHGLGAVRMVAVAFDVDGPTHGTDEPAPASWYKRQRPRIDALVADHPGAGVYATRGGLRTIYLIEPIKIDNLDDAMKWRRIYIGWANYLQRRYGLVVDRGCADWTRLYRAPFVVRDGVAEDRPILHEPGDLGIWSPTLKSSDVPPLVAVTHGEAPTNGGALPKLFALREWLGPQISTGIWRVRCPWIDEHTSGEAFDTSCVLYGAAPGKQYGHLNCLHSHCTDPQTSKCKRTPFACLELFTADELSTVGIDPKIVVRSPLRDAIKKWSTRK